MIASLVLGAILAANPASASTAPDPFRFWLPGHREVQRQFEQKLNAVPTAASLRTYHELIGGEPHVAGTPGDERAIEKLVKAFDDMGLEVQQHDIWVYLAKPIDAKLEIIEPSAKDTPDAESRATTDRRGVIGLPLKETNLLEDPFSAHADLTWGWNAYSGSGDVTAEIVYANYGTRDDFATLKALGIDCTGKIVLTRYGQNFRGYKAKFAEEAGAAGLIIFTDPADSGYAQGIPYPEGGWANDTCIQRGSLVTLDYPGDPLTPGTEATQKAQRLNPEEVALPRIPVQPIGYAAAMQIITRMKGAPVPKESPVDLDRDLYSFRGWQGGLPLTYRVSGGPDLKLRLMVKQERAITKTANVIATLPGSTWPEEKVILGCHHDAWGFGAADPLAGLMVLMESARSFAELAKTGLKPARTIVFATWGAEEFGILGSTEWVEANRDDLLKNAVAYVNLDMAAMGPDFGASATPSLRGLIEDVVRAVPQARSGGAETVSNAWRLQAKNKGQDQPVIGTLGGGSDHVGFVCHLAVPSVSFGASGGEGTSYHSNYDTLAWYRQVVGDDYEPALMLTRIVNLFAARLANADVLPLDATVWAAELRAQLKAAEEHATKRGMTLDHEHLLRQIDDLEIEARTTQTQLAAALGDSRLDPGQLGRMNQALIAVERAWLDPEGIPQRPWFANLYVSSDPNSGYAPLMLPKVAWGVETGDAKALAWSLLPLYDTVQRMGERLAEVRAAIASP